MKKDCQKEFMKIFNQLAYKYNRYDVWRDFVTTFACSISNSLDKCHYEEREKRYLKIIGKYEKTEQNIFPELAARTVIALEENQDQDFLGDIFMMLNLGNNVTGQFFTPYHICRLMAMTTLGNICKQIREKGFVTINDPCCGAGAILIAAINEARKQLKKENLNFQNSIFLAAQDIDETVVLMCYIQLSLLGIA